MLLIEADNDLRLDRAIAQPGDDGLLDFRQGSRGGGNLAGVRNIDAALLVNGLRRQIDKVAGTSTGGGRGREQTARRGFENRYVEDIADTGDLLGFGRLSGNRPWNVTTLGCERKPMVSALTSTSA